MSDDAKTVPSAGLLPAHAYADPVPRSKAQRRHNLGLGAFTLPGLLKISAQNAPARKKRFGKDPFTGQERWFAPKPATVRITARALEKLKDAAL
jgi:hypothetical protein